MWSHYADGHRGVVIGVEVENNVEVNYLNQSYILENTNDISINDVAKKILSNKHELWSYEQEERLFSREKFVKVEVKHVIFGKKVNEEKKEFLTKLIRRLDDTIEIFNIVDLEDERNSILTY